MIPADRAPGEDCFTGHLFKICWHIIKYDVVDLVRGFFSERLSSSRYFQYFADFAPEG